MSNIESSIMSVSKDGMRVTLMNGSKYRISPGDSTKCITWYQTQRIVVEETHEDVYPFKLINLDTSSPDEARCQKI